MFKLEFSIIKEKNICSKNFKIIKKFLFKNIFNNYKQITPILRLPIKIFTANLIKIEL